MFVFPKHSNLFAIVIVLTMLFSADNLRSQQEPDAYIQRGEQISIIDFDSLPTNVLLGATNITLDGSVQTNGSLTATGQVCDANGCIGQVVPTVQEALVTFDLPSGFGGGAATTATAWVKRDLNQQIYDVGDIVSLSSSQITLDAGTYRISSGQTFFCDDRKIQSFRARLRNVTDDSTAAISMTGRLDAPSGTSGNAEANIPPTLFTINSTKTFELQYYIEVDWDNANALGFPIGSGEDERFAWVYIEKL